MRTRTSNLWLSLFRLKIWKLTVEPIYTNFFKIAKEDGNLSKYYKISRCPSIFSMMVAILATLYTGCK